MAERKESSEPKVIYCAVENICVPKLKKSSLKIRVKNVVSEDNIKHKCKTPYFGSNFNKISMKNKYNPIRDLYTWSEDSLKDIESDFDRLKSKSQLQQTRNEIKNLLCSSTLASSNFNDFDDLFNEFEYEEDKEYFEVERAKNPFYKNLD